MAVYVYKAMDVDSAAASGTVVADTPRQARDILRDRGLAVMDIREHRGSGRFAHLFKRKGSREENASFIRGLSTLLTAGIPLLPALHTLVKQHKHGYQAVIQRLADDVASGLGLAEAMAQQREHFDELSISIVQVGENTGSLEDSLRNLSRFKEKMLGLRSRVTTALIYPVVVSIIGLAVTVFLMTSVVPNLLETLRQSGRPLPMITEIVAGISDFLVDWWWVLLLGVIAAMAGIKAALSTERGGLIADAVSLRIPILGDLIRKENTSRMTVVLAGLLRSGLNFLDSVEITKKTLRNRTFRKAMDEYETAVRAGSDIAKPLEQAGVFSPVVVQILAVGQQTGQLEEMLAELSETYDREVAIAAQRLTSVLEPVLIVVLAVLVGFIAFATILPILEVSNVL